MPQRIQLITKLAPFAYSAECNGSISRQNPGGASGLQIFQPSEQNRQRQAKLFILQKTIKRRDLNTIRTSQKLRNNNPDSNPARNFGQLVISFKMHVKQTLQRRKRNFFIDKPTIIGCCCLQICSKPLESIVLNKSILRKYLGNKPNLVNYKKIKKRKKLTVDQEENFL